MINTEKSLTALVVDDHPVTHMGCRSLLCELGFTNILKAEDGLSALKQIQQSPPDLILLDLGLPGEGGLKVLPKITDKLKQLNCDAPVLIFSMHENPSFAALALEQGAIGFLSKNAAPNEFINAINTVMKGKVYLDQTIAVSVAARNKGQTSLSQLTPRETQILSMITSGLSYEQIAEQIQVSYKTVVNVSSTLRRKLSARNLSDLIRLGIEMDITENKSPQMRGQ